jgi:outer membrane protein OmpA-like peptidoglycan-associated protein
MEEKICKVFEGSFESINFERNSADLTESAKESLSAVADALIEYEYLTVNIAAHTDSVGDNEENQKLSEDRARSVRDYLVTQGVESSRLTYVGYGERRPLVDNDTTEGRAINRRVEFNLPNAAGACGAQESTDEEPDEARSSLSQQCDLLEGAARNILFEPGSSRLTSGSKEALDDVAAAFIAQDIFMGIAAHTDSVGEEKENQLLSNLRAQTVRKYLISKGVPAWRLNALGYGESRPVADNETPEGRALNRRVEFILPEEFKQKCNNANSIGQ